MRGLKRLLSSPSRPAFVTAETHRGIVVEPEVIASVREWLKHLAGRAH